LGGQDLGRAAQQHAEDESLAEVRQDKVKYASKEGGGTTAIPSNEFEIAGARQGVTRPGVQKGEARRLALFYLVKTTSGSSTSLSSANRRAGRYAIPR
jgi:hypothetical protein